MSHWFTQVTMASHTYNTIPSADGAPPKTTGTMKLLVACALAASFVLGTLAVAAVSGAGDPSTFSLLFKPCGGDCDCWYRTCGTGFSCNDKDLYSGDKNNPGKNKCVKNTEKGHKCDVKGGVNCGRGLCCVDETWLYEARIKPRCVVGIDAMGEWCSSPFRKPKTADCQGISENEQK